MLSTFLSIAGIFLASISILTLVLVPNAAALLMKMPEMTIVDAAMPIKTMQDNKASINGNY